MVAVVVVVVFVVVVVVAVVVVVVVLVVVVVVVAVVAVVHRIIKSGSKPSVFDTFDLEMCFAPQRRALFRHRMAIGSSKSRPNPTCFGTFHFEMCFAPQPRALFRHRTATKSSEPQVFCHFLLQNVLRATTACTFSTAQLPKVARS